MFTENNRNKHFDENSGCKISTGLNEKKFSSNVSQQKQKQWQVCHCDNIDGSHFKRKQEQKTEWKPS